MSPKRRWWLLALVSIPVAIASSGCCSLKCREATAPLVFVSEVPDKASRDPIVISKKAKQEIVWRLSAGSTITSIDISLGGQPVPFENCATSGSVCRIACHNRACVSGAVSEALEPVPSKGYYYDYGFYRSPSGKSSDPGIRIDP
jgi:hypothetical protein